MVIKFDPVKFLPIEVQDLILEKLDYASIISASRVCSLWRELGFRKLRRYCESNIPVDALKELKNAEIGLGWDSVYLRWVYGGLPAATTDLFQEENVQEKSHHQPIGSMAMADKFVLVGDTKGVLSAYNVMDQDALNPVLSLDLKDDYLYQIVFVEGFRLLLVVGEATIHFVSLTEKELIPMHCKHFPMLCRRVSAYGHQLVLDRRPDVLHLMEIFDIQDNLVTLNFVQKIQNTEWIYSWNLFGSQIMCLLNSGEVTCWDINKGAWVTTTEVYSEVKYQNPCWFFRDSIFCSSQTSRCLLAYWHMDRGISYWMVGQPGPYLEKVYLGANREEVVTCVSLGRRLLVLGTDSGKVMVYSCLPNSGRKHSQFDYNRPCLEFQLDERPIKSIYMNFTCRMVLICARLNRQDFKCICLDAGI